MKATSIELDECMYSHILRTCIKAQNPDQFLMYLNEMMHTIQVLQKDGPCIHVLQEFSTTYVRFSTFSIISIISIIFNTNLKSVVSIHG